jgi:hypothetical protein
MKDERPSGTSSIRLGLFLLGLLLIGNEWALARLFSPDGSIHPAALTAIRVTDGIVLVIAAALLALRPRLNLNPGRFLASLETGRALRAALVIGLVMRVAVFAVQRPENNDPHLEVIQYIFEERALPAADLMLMAFHPPLYYLLAAPWLAFQSAKVVQVFSLLLSLANFLLLYRLARATSLLQSPMARLHAVLFLALLPQFIIFGNFVSNDTLAYLLGTVIALAALHYADNPTPRSLLYLSAAAGLGLLTKSSFLAFLPGLTLLLYFTGRNAGFTLRQQAATLIVFGLFCTVFGGYKFLENHLAFDTAFPDAETLHHGYVERQSGTVQGIGSLLDFNLVKLIRHPFLDQPTIHSVPLLLYGTFWYGYIPESNFMATRYFPFNLLPRAIIVLGLVPTLLIAAGLVAYLHTFQPFRRLPTASGAELADSLKATALTLFLLGNFGLVVLWGLINDAWSFFQGRLIFPSILSIALALGWGYQALTGWRPQWRAGLDALLLLNCTALVSYMIAEVAKQII